MSLTLYLQMKFNIKQYLAEKMYSPKKVISPRKPPLSPKGAGLKRSLPPKTLANYFKISSKCKGIDGEVTSEEKNEGRYFFLIMSYLLRWKCCTVYVELCAEKDRFSSAFDTWGIFEASTWKALNGFTPPSCSIIHPSAGNTQNSREVKKDAQMKSINEEGGEHNRKSATSLILFEEVKFT